MKITLTLTTAAILLAGCTQTKFSSGNVTLTRTSFLQKLEFQTVEFSTNGTATLQGYKNDGGNEALAGITAAAVAAAVKAAK